MSNGNLSANVGGLIPNDHLCTPCSGSRFFSKAECERIIKTSGDRPFMDGTVGASSAEQVKSSVRKTDITRLLCTPETSWIYEKLWKTIAGANGHYGYDISGIENLQIGRYTEGGFYDWHIDLGSSQASLRKLSVTVQLSDASAYKGGDLEFKDFADFKADKEMGSIIIFPSFLLHRVTPVMEGERWSMVAWVIGRPFR